VTFESVEELIAAMPGQWAAIVQRAADWSGKRGTVSMPCHLVVWAQGEMNRLKRRVEELEMAAEREA
jgi:hypothetical protein